MMLTATNFPDLIIGFALIEKIASSRQPHFAYGFPANGGDPANTGGRWTFRLTPPNIKLFVGDYYGF